MTVDGLIERLQQLKADEAVSGDTLVTTQTRAGDMVRVITRAATTPVSKPDAEKGKNLLNLVSRGGVRVVLVV